VELPSNIAAAKTAEDLGAPLPYGLATDSKPLQAATKAAQQLPMVGPKIGEQAAKTVMQPVEGSERSPTIFPEAWSIGPQPALLSDRQSKE